MVKHFLKINRQKMINTLQTSILDLIPHIAEIIDRPNWTLNFCLDKMEFGFIFLPKGGYIYCWVEARGNRIAGYTKFLEGVDKQEEIKRFLKEFGNYYNK